VDKLSLIFKRQQELTTEFQRIEVHNGLCDYALGIPFDLSNPLAQKQLRATAWYAIEEIGEALNATNEQDKQEEVVDVFHFLVELLLCSGATPEGIYPFYEEDKLEKLFTIASAEYTTLVSTMYLCERLADAMHCLKAKPWKQNPKETSKVIYQHKLFGVLFAFIEFAKAFGLTPDSLFNLYMGKANVNQKRIDNGA
jgi:hypothetical protein